VAEQHLPNFPARGEDNRAPLHKLSCKLCGFWKGGRLDSPAQREGHSTHALFFRRLGPGRYVTSHLKLTQPSDFAAAHQPADARIPKCAHMHECIELRRRCQADDPFCRKMAEITVTLMK
jgi:hypothetical protein